MSRILFILVTASTPLLLYARKDIRDLKTYLSLPYIVNLVVDHNQKTSGGSGALISPEWVLTAAHCADEPFVTHIQYGNSSRDIKCTRSLFSEIVKRIQHPGYRRGKRLSNDIGLLRVTPVYVSTYAQISAVDYSSLVGRPVEFAGFGGFKTKNDDNRMDQKERKDRRDRTDRIDRMFQFGKGVVSACEENLSAGPFICVASKCSEQNENYNFDDNSGGPLLYDDKIAGIISRTKEKTPIGRFTAVSPFLIWIYKELIPTNENGDATR